MASETLPLLGEEAFGYYQTFSKNISDFLNARGIEVTLPKGALQGIKCWFVTLSDDTHLHVYAETISEQSATCDQCRIIGKRDCTFLRVIRSVAAHFRRSLIDQPTIVSFAGWGTHPVSSVRYHFIIPAEVSTRRFAHQRLISCPQHSIIF